MNVHLRQMCLVAGSIERVVNDLSDVLGLRVCHGSGDLSRYGLPARGPMSEGGRTLLADKGVENVVLPIGRDFLEVVAPLRADSSAHRYLERRHGDGGYMVIFQAADLAGLRERCERRGVRIVFAADFARYRDVHLHTRDVRGAIVSFAMNVPDNLADGAWYPAGALWEHWPRPDNVLGIAGAEIQSDEPEALAARWSEVMGLPCRSTGHKRLCIDIDNGELRFVPAQDGRGEGVGGLDVRARQPQTLLDAARRHGHAVDGDVALIGGLRLRLIGSSL